jgi:hypothetical protein
VEAVKRAVEAAGGYIAAGSAAPESWRR